MAVSSQISEKIKLTEEQVQEGYHVEVGGNSVLVWHRKNQIALLLASQDINRKVRQVIEQRRKELREVEKKTGWQPEQP